jgi:hypothetical protein
VNRRSLFAWAWCIGAVLAVPTAADVRNCTGPMVTGGLCQAPTDALLSYSIPAGAQADFMDAYAAAANYQAEVPCGAERLVDDSGIVVQAGPGQSTCAAETAGELVANPQTRAAAVDRYIRAELVRVVRDHRRRQAEAAAADTTAAEPDPEIP